MLTNMLSRPQLPYNTNQANYALALGGYSGLASQAYAGLNAQGQPQGFPAGTSQGGDGTGGQSGQTNGAQSQPLNMQMFLRPQMGQQGLLQGQGLQALSVGQQNLNPRGPPQAGQMGARPGYLPTQQSVASQLLSQQPIASHAMGRQVHIAFNVLNRFLPASSRLVTSSTIFCFISKTLCDWSRPHYQVAHIFTVRIAVVHKVFTCPLRFTGLLQCNLHR